MEKRPHNVVVGFNSFYLDRESGRLTRRAYAGLEEIGAKTYHVEKRPHNVVVGFYSFYLNLESGRLTGLCGT